MTLQLNSAESEDEVRQSAMPWDLPVGLLGFLREEMKTAHNQMVATKEVDVVEEAEVQPRLLAVDEVVASFKIVAPIVDVAEEVGVDLVAMENSKEAEAAIIKMATMM
jgi:putative NADH-flavin reductase